MIAADDQRPILAVVGNGMISHAFCKKLSELDVLASYSVIVFGDEPRPAYDRVNLSQMLAGSGSQELELASEQWYAELGVQLHVGERVTELDLSSKSLRCDSGLTKRFDKLVLATGSKPFVPPLPGVDLPGVFVYRTIEDLESIAKYSETAKSAAVLGGGLLGLEAAKCLIDLELQAHVVEMAPTLMPRQLDTEGAHYLQDQIEKLGIEFHLPKQTTSITPQNDQCSLNFTVGDPLVVDMIVISAGIRPRNELAETSKIKIGRRGGFVINDQLETSCPDVFAIGECAEHDEVVYGLYAPGLHMATVLAQRLAGQSSTFVGGDQSAKLKLLGVDVATIGEPLSEIPHASTLASSHEDYYRKLILSKGKPVALLSVGPWPEMNRVQQAIAAGTRIWPWHRFRFERSGDLWPTKPGDSVTTWPADAIVCSCQNVSRGELTAACQAGCETVCALAEATGASTVCGSCQPLLADLVDSPDEAETTPVKSGLLWASIAAALILMVWLTVGEISVAQSVTDSWHRLDLLLQNPWFKHISGYSLLGVASIGLLLPLRKRFRWFSFGDFGWWRTMHATIGSLTLIGLIVHTGMRLGANLNFLLGGVFLAINLTGVLVGVITSMENRFQGTTAIALRRWRPRVTRIHFWLLWPLPALLAIHIFCAYYY